MALPRLGPADVAGLRLLVDTVETGSLSAAARAARISQPSASESLRRLERRLGVTLLVRTTRGSRPTSAGRYIAGLGQRALAALDTVAAEAAALRAAERHEVRVAASYTIAEYVLPARLSAISGMTVALSVVNSVAATARVRSREADVGFVEGPVDVSGLRVQRIARDELIVVTAPGRPWSRLAAPLSPATLAATGLLLREPESGTRRSYEDCLSRMDLATAPPLGVLTSTEALKAAVRAGVGDSVLSRLAVAADLAAGALVEVPVAGLRLSRDLRAVWLPRPSNSLGAGFIRAVVGASGPPDTSSCPKPDTSSRSGTAAP